MLREPIVMSFSMLECAQRFGACSYASGLGGKKIGGGHKRAGSRHSWPAASKSVSGNQKEDGTPQCFPVSLPGRLP